MKLLCFQAKAFRWQTHAKTLPDIPDLAIHDQVRDTLVVFLHVESADSAQERQASVLRQSVKHIKWLANKRSHRKIVLHSFTHLGGATAEPAIAEKFINLVAERLRDTSYEVWVTPFGYLCEWDLSVHGESLAKVWKEIH